MKASRETAGNGSGTGLRFQAQQYIADLGLHEVHSVRCMLRQLASAHAQYVT